MLMLCLNVEVLRIYTLFAYSTHAELPPHRVPALARMASTVIEWRIVCGGVVGFHFWVWMKSSAFATSITYPREVLNFALTYQGWTNILSYSNYKSTCPPPKPLPGTLPSVLVSLPSKLTFSMRPAKIFHRTYRLAPSSRGTGQTSICCCSWGSNSRIARLGRKKGYPGSGQTAARMRHS